MTSRGATRPTDSSQILVPARALAELQKLSSGAAKDDSSDKSAEGDGGSSGVPRAIGLSIGDHDVTFTAGSVKVSTRLLDGSYPDYRQLIPSDI